MLEPGRGVLSLLLLVRPSRGGCLCVVSFLGRRSARSRQYALQYKGGPPHDALSEAPLALQRCKPCRGRIDDDIDRPFQLSASRLEVRLRLELRQISRNEEDIHVTAWQQFALGSGAKDHRYIS